MRRTSYAVARGTLRAVDERFDLVVIGAGPAGERGAAQAAYFGKRVAIVERQPPRAGRRSTRGRCPRRPCARPPTLSGYRQRDRSG
jgi:NAD(P) transhydrogenase